MTNLSTAEVANELDTTPKVLRRFLRAEPLYANAGCGGRYVFTPGDLPKLRKRFTAWSTKKQSAPKRARVTSHSDDGLSVELLCQPIHRQSAATREAAARLTRDRDARLIAQLQLINS